MTLQSNWRMGNTLSMSHPPVFVSEPNLTPSDKKLGRGALRVVLSDERDKKDERDEREVADRLHCNIALQHCTAPRHRTKTPHHCTAPRHRANITHQDIATLHCIAVPMPLLVIVSLVPSSLRSQNRRSLLTITNYYLLIANYPIVCIRTEALIRAMARMRLISTSLSAWCWFWLTRRI